MLKRLVNACEIEFEFVNTTPILVKDGRWQQPKGQQTFAAVFQCRDDEKTMYEKALAGDLESLTYFIPGSSMRGVFRSQMERIARAFSPENPIVCNLFVDPDKEAMGQAGATEAGCAFNKEVNGYKDSCPACRIFGSTKHAGRISFSDGEVLDRGTIAITEQIAIDRFAGSVRAGPFKLMMLEGAKFKTSLRIRNFELWQLGLLAYVFKDLKAGRLQIGMGKNLERGHVKCDPTHPTTPQDLKIRIAYYGPRSPEHSCVKGLYELVDDARYGFVPRADKNGIANLLGTPQSDCLEHTFPVTNSEAFWRALATEWNAAVDSRVFPCRAVAAKK